MYIWGVKTIFEAIYKVNRGSEVSALFFNREDAVNYLTGKAEVNWGTVHNTLLTENSVTMNYGQCEYFYAILERDVS